MVRIVFSGFVFLIAPACFAQTPKSIPSQNTTVRGQIVQQSGVPIRKADISLFSIGSHGEAEDVQYSAVTDAEGRFSFDNVKPGTYRVTYEHPGFVDAEKRHHGDRMLLFVNPSDQSKDLLFHMSPAAVITGKVLDSDGDPVPRVSVSAVPYPRNPLAIGSGGETDELGEFRMGGLPPKQYLLVAQPLMQLVRAVQSAKKSESVTPVYGTTYYPNTTDAGQAIPVRVQAGDQIQLNIQLVPAHLLRVRGEISNIPPGATDVGLILRPLDDMFMAAIDPWPVDKDGNFEVRGVLPGSYSALLTFGEGKTSRTVRCDQTIQVSSADLDGLRLSALPNGQIRGRFRTENGKPPDWSLLEVRLSSSRNSLRRRIQGNEMSSSNGMESIYWDDGLSHADVKTDGSFEMKDLPSDTYFLGVTAADDSFADYYVKSVYLSGRDVTDSGLATTGTTQTLDVVMSVKGASVEGVVSKDKDQPATYVKVILIPDEKRSDRKDLFAQATTDRHGHFSLRGIAPGEYQIMALDEDDFYEEINNPAFVSAHELMGETVELGEAEQKNIALKVVATEE